MGYTFCYNPETAVVETTKGKVRGFTKDGLSIFKGIPYAKAKRFHAPVPLEAWEGVLDATSFGYVCPLLDPSAKPNGELLVPHRYWVMHEDCQNLNVWTPACDDGKRPVLVWLHGGGYEAGSAIEHIAYEGENMSRIGQVVVVSINHRLNVLGYCDLSDFGEEYANSGNAGTDDIIAALHWIQDNIAAFGGDPDNVTVFGQSGGGAKVTTLLQTPAADGLFAKGMNMSGVIGLLKDERGSGRELVEGMMKELGTDSVKELEEVPYEALARAYLKVRPVLQQEGKYVGGKPFRNAYYLGAPEEAGFRKETAHIPMLVGTVYGEFTSFAPTDFDKSRMTKEEGEEKLTELLGKEVAGQLLPMFKEAYPERNPIDLLNIDFIFRKPAQDYIKLRSAINNCTWSYLFNQDMPVDNGRTPWHCADIPYVFHNTEMVYNTWQEGREKLEGQIFGSLMAFAKTGDPNNESIPDWPASRPGEENTMVFDADTRLRVNHDAKLVPAAREQMEPLLIELFAKNAGKVQH